MTTTTAVASATPAVDPRAAPALQAYEAYSRASEVARQKPVSKGEKYPPGGDFTKYSFDPARSTDRLFIWALAAGGAQYRGTPPDSHVRVTSVDLGASSWPTVILTDCQTGLDQWNAYDIQTGKKLPFQVGKVPPPYLSTITVIKYQGHWGVQNLTSDSSRTCTA